jgi:hypothetical protein
MAPSPTSFLGWPGWRLLGVTFVLAAALTLWWLLVYVSCDACAERRSDRIRVHLEVERSLPFVPACVVVYRSIDVMLLLGPFILRTLREIQALTLTMFVAITLAGVGFVMLPAEKAYPPMPDAGLWEPLIAWNRRIILNYNLVPSLHVALSVLTLAAYGTRCGKRGKALLATWGTAILLSTLLIHEHHLLDAILGLALGWASYFFVYKGMCRRANR